VHSTIACGRLRLDLCPDADQSDHDPLVPSSLRARIGAGWMRAINHVSGAVIFAFGFYAILGAFKR
jgi:hypothetical protein